MIFCYFDGSCNNNGNNGDTGIGFLAVKGDKKIIEISKFAGSGTNNTAEYMALIEGLKALIEGGYNKEKCIIYGDSQLVIMQVTGKWNCYKEHLKPLLAETQRLLQCFGAVQINWVNREKNAEADRLSKEGLERGLSNSLNKQEENDDTTQKITCFDLGNGIFKVCSESGKSYAVDMNYKVCTCPQFRFRGKVCKHIVAVEEKVG